MAQGAGGGFTRSMLAACFRCAWGEINLTPHVPKVSSSHAIPLHAMPLTPLLGHACCWCPLACPTRCPRPSALCGPPASRRHIALRREPTVLAAGGFKLDHTQLWRRQCCLSPGFSFLSLSNRRLSFHSPVKHVVDPAAQARTELTICHERHGPATCGTRAPRLTRHASGGLSKEGRYA